MEFWSKGLGEKRIDLLLSKGDSTSSGDKLYVQGQMEAPVSWDYIMPLDDEDLVDFLAMMREQSLADCIYHSPDRWQLYRTMIKGGLQLGFMLLVAWVKNSLGGSTQEEPVIQVPPPAERKRRPARRRLGSKRSGEPPPSETDTACEKPHRVASA